MSPSNLSVHRLESLRRLLGKARASSAAGLSEMVGGRIDATAPRVLLRPVQSLYSLFGKPEAEVVAVYLGITGDLDGHIALALSVEGACDLADMLYGQPEGTTKSLDTMARSALGEAGNLTGSFFLNAIADASSTTITPTPPAVVIDMGGAILDAILADLWADGEEVLVIETQFSQQDRAVGVKFLVVPSSRSLHRFIETLKP